MLKVSKGTVFQTHLYYLFILRYYYEDHLKKLRHELFIKRGYDKRVRPAKDWEQTTDVGVALTVTRIGSVNAVDQTLNVDAWLALVIEKIVGTVLKTLNRIGLMIISHGLHRNTVVSL